MNTYQYQQPPPMTTHGAYPNPGPAPSSAPQVAPHGQPQPNYGSVPPSGVVMSNRAPRHGRIQRYIRKNPEKTYMMLSLISVVLIAVLSVCYFGFNGVFATLPKLVAFVAGAVAVKKRCVFTFGFASAFHIVSTIFLVAVFAFRHLGFTIMVISLAIVDSSLVLLAVQNSKRILAELQGNPINDASSEDDGDVDLVVNINHERSTDVYVSESPVHVPAPQMSVPHASPAHMPAPMTYPQAPMYHVASSPVSQMTQMTQMHEASAPHSSEERMINELFYKHQVALKLLEEMNFSRTYAEKVRNANLLEAHNGDIQAVVTEIISQNN